MSDMHRLPAQFAEFEKFCPRWRLETENERYLARAHAPYPELVELYDEMTPRLSEIVAHLNGFPLDAMPEAEANLMYLTFSLMEASHAVELWKQSDVPDAFAPERIKIKLSGAIAEGALK